MSLADNTSRKNFTPTPQGLFFVVWLVSLGFRLFPFFSFCLLFSHFLNPPLFFFCAEEYSQKWKGK